MEIQVTTGTSEDTKEQFFHRTCLRPNYLNIVSEQTSVDIFMLILHHFPNFLIFNDVFICERILLKNIKNSSLFVMFCHL